MSNFAFCRTIIREVLELHCQARFSLKVLCCIERHTTSTGSESPIRAVWRHSTVGSKLTHLALKMARRYHYAFSAKRVLSACQHSLATFEFDLANAAICANEYHTTTTTSPWSHTAQYHPSAMPDGSGQ
eukprot:6195395-Pleurochrysis_carterae.AAC.1